MDEMVFLTYNEERQLLKEKKDSQFETDYNFLTFGMFYQMYEWASDAFNEIEGRLSSLHRQLEYTRRYIEEYLNFSKKAEQDIKNDNSLCASVYDAYFYRYYVDKLYLDEYNYSSILLQLYASFEKFVKDLSVEVAQDRGIEVKVRGNSGKPVVDQYIEFLDLNCKLNANYYTELRKRFNVLRLIRNKYVHNLGEGLSVKQIKLIKEYYPDVIECKRVKIDYEFLISAFETVGEICKVFEQACDIELRGSNNNT